MSYNFDSLLKEIPIWDIENVKIGNAEDKEHATGCTVILCENGAPAGVDVRGGGPASRETELLNPNMQCTSIHAVLLSGGSAFGLDAAGGVMEYLAEHGFGFPVGPVKVPLVVESCIFDLLFASSEVKPDKEMARRACEAAQLNRPTEGNVGAGCGATVGKLGAPDCAMNSGLGIYAVSLGDLKVGAVVSVNALGDVIDEESGEIIAGVLTPDHKGFANGEKAMYEMFLNKFSKADLDPEAKADSEAKAADETRANSEVKVADEAKSAVDTKPSVEAKSAVSAKAPIVTNTTIGCIITNAHFEKPQLNKIAGLTQNGYARSIRPVHTMGDGDTIYALSVGDVEADINLVGTLAARVMAQAVKNAVLHTEGFHGLLAACDIAKGNN